MNNHMILLIMIKLSSFSHINTVQHGALASWSGGFHGGTHGRLLFLTRKAVGCCGADPDDPGKIWKFDKMSEIFLHIAAAKAGIENPMDRTLRIYKGQGSYKWLLLGKAFIQEHVRSYISIQWPMRKKNEKIWNLLVVDFKPRHNKIIEHVLLPEPLRQCSYSLGALPLWLHQSTLW